MVGHDDWSLYRKQMDLWKKNLKPLYLENVFSSFGLTFTTNTSHQLPWKSNILSSIYWPKSRRQNVASIFFIFVLNSRFFRFCLEVCTFRDFLDNFWNSNPMEPIWILYHPMNHEKNFSNLLKTLFCRNNGLIFSEKIIQGWLIVWIGNINNSRCPINALFVCSNFIISM